MSVSQDFTTIVNILIELCPDSWEEKCDNLMHAIGILSIDKAYPEYKFTHLELKHARYITTIPNKNVSNPDKLKETFEKGIDYIRNIDDKDKGKIYGEYYDELYTYAAKCLINIYYKRGL